MNVPVGHKRVLVVGCGGVGGLTAVALKAAGHDVVGITGNPTIAEVIRKDGLTAVSFMQTRQERFPAYAQFADAPNQPPFDVLLLATPPNFIETALDDGLSALLPTAPVVCFQNGLGEERAAKHIGKERVIGGIVTYGATMLRPGHVEQTSAGGYTLGRLEGGSDPALEMVARLLRDAGPTEFTDNLRGARWSKLAINCAISSLGTVGGDRLGTLMRHRMVRRMCLEVMTEVVQVALAEGVALEKVSGTLDLEWFALDDDERLLQGSPSLLAKHTVLLAVGAKYRRLRSSMLGAIERGRPPSVDFLNGEIVTRGAAHHIATPVNQALVAAVHAIAAGDRRADVESLRQVFAETRGQLRGLGLAA